jgi:aminoglycoside 3-N-acetyltransferase
MRELIKNELQTVVRQAAKRMLPHKLLIYLRERHLKARRRSSVNARTHHTLSDIKRQLSEIGIDRERDIFVHSSLGQIGIVEGGASGVLDCLASIVSPSVNILMPAYPFVGSMQAWMEDSAPFDVLLTPSRMGALTECFRTTEGAGRSCHPTHSVTVLGPRRDEYISRHHLSPTPCGPYSPFKMLFENKGQILCLGSGIGKITAYHLIEDLVDFPLQVYLNKLMSKNVVFPDRSTHLISTKVGDPRLSPWRIDNFKPKQIEFLGYLRSAGVVREARIGNAICHLLDVEALVNLQKKLLEQKITIYYRPKLRLLSSFPAR